MTETKSIQLLRTAPSRLGSRKWTRVALIIPTLIFLSVFFLWPVMLTFGESFGGANGPFTQYQVIIEQGSYQRIILRTVTSALVITAVCLLLAYPYAYAMSIARPRVMRLLSGIVLVSFFTSIMVRSFAWIVLMQGNGIIDRLWKEISGESLVLRGTETGVVIAMAQVLLPFMIFSLYSNMTKIDRRLLLASSSLGANKTRSFLRIYLPLSVPGIVSGSVIVFVTALGFYIIPGLVGSPSQQLLSQLIYTLIDVSLNTPLASAAAVVLLICALIIVLPFMRHFDSEGGAGGVLGGNPGGQRLGLGLRIFSGLVAALLLLPGLVVIPLSFTGSSTFVFPPESWSLRWYENLFTNPAWTDSITLSVTLAITVAVLSVVLALLAALAMQRRQSRWVGVARGAILAPRIVPGIIIALAVYSLFLTWGLSATFPGFVIAHTVLALPFAFIPISAALAQTDKRLEDAASSLGSTPLQTLWRVVLPGIMPGVLTGAVFSFVISFDEVVLSLFISSLDIRTLPVQMYRAITTDIDPTIAAASTLLLLITSLLVAAAVFWPKRKDSLR